jgi:hypothetical protein
MNLRIPIGSTVVLHHMTAVKVYDGDGFTLSGYFADQYPVSVKVIGFLGSSILGGDSVSYPLTPERDDNFYSVWSVTTP